MMWKADPQFADRIAGRCIEKYDSLGSGGKPHQRNEWTSLSGIVKVEEQSGGGGEYSCCVVSLGTGTKCLGCGSLSKAGDILNDSHSEVIARRAFLRYLYSEIERRLDGDESVFGFDVHYGKLKVKPSVSFHFFTSQPPCGDAAIFTKIDCPTHLRSYSIELCFI
jgi:tRNA-specific adenosine deaminase 1